MAVTPNYSWPIPVATDYVKDGWDAIADLGNAIDSTVYGLGSSGLSLISNTTITTQSAQNITNCFSATYDNYLMIFNLTATSATAALNFQLLNNTTPQTTEYYYAFRGITSSGTNADIYASNQSSIYLAHGSAAASVDAYQTSAIIGINKPYLAANTTFHYSSSNTNASAYYSETGSALSNSQVSYNGIRLAIASGTFSANVKIYGYKNS